MTRLAAWAEGLIEVCWLVAIAATPLYFNVFSNRVFEPDKMIFLRCIALVMLLGWIVVKLESLGRGPSLSSFKLELVPAYIWRWVKSDPITAGAIGLLIVGGIASALSIVPATSLWGSYQRLQGYYGFASFIVVFLMMRRGLRTQAQIDRVVRTFLLISLPVAVYGIMQFLRLDPLPWSGDTSVRVTSTMGNAIFMAAYLIMAIPFVIARLVQYIRQLLSMGSDPERESDYSDLVPVNVFGLIVLVLVVGFLSYIVVSANNPGLWWGMYAVVVAFVLGSLLLPRLRSSRRAIILQIMALVVLLVVQGAAIVLSGSRGPWLGLGAGIAVMAIALAITVKRRWVRWSVGAVFAVLIIGLAVFNLPNSPLSGLKSVPYIGRFGSLLESETGTGKVRLLIWQGVGELMTTRPGVGLGDDNLSWLRPVFGYGPESMYVAYNKAYQPDLAHVESRTASPDRSHNDTLDTLVNTGFVGVIIYLGLILALAVTCWRLFVDKSRPLWLQLTALGCLGTIVAHFFESQFGIVIASTRTQFWVTAAIVVVLPWIEKRQTALAQVPIPTASEAKPALVTEASKRFGGSATKPKSKKGAQRARVAERPVERNRPAQDRAWWYNPGVWAVVAFVVVSLIGLVALRNWVQVSDVQVALGVGAIWAFVGLCFGAVRLTGDSGVKFWSPQWALAYVAAAVFVGVFCFLNLNVVAADVYYKRGLGEDDRAQQYATAGQTQNAIRSRIEAITGYRKAIEVASYQDFYFLFLGRSYIEMAKTTTTKTSATPLEPTLEKALRMTSRELSNLSQADVLGLAEVTLKEAYRLAPLNTDHAANLARMYRTWAELLDPSKLTLSERYYSEALTLSPRSALLWDEWAQVALVRGDVQAALERLVKAESLDKEYVPTFVLLGDTYQLMGRASDAAEAHEKALQVDPTSLSDARFDQRMQWYLDQNLGISMTEAYSEAVALAPMNAMVRGSYGFLLARMGQFPQAAVEFEAQVKLSPTDWMAYRNLALVYRSIGRNSEALGAAQQSLKLAPESQKQPIQDFITQLQAMGVTS